MESRAALSLQQPAERAPTPSGEPRRRLSPFQGWRHGDVGCFEGAHDDLVQHVVTGGKGLIVVRSNDATFGRSGQTEQPRPRPACTPFRAGARPRVPVTLTGLIGLDRAARRRSA